MESNAGFRDSLPNMKELDDTPMFHYSSGGSKIVHRGGWRWSCRDNTHLNRRVPTAIFGTSRNIFHSVIDRSQWKVWNPFAPHVEDSLCRKKRRAHVCTRADTHAHTRACAQWYTTENAQGYLCQEIRQYRETVKNGGRTGIGGKGWEMKVEISELAGEGGGGELISNALKSLRAQFPNWC